ncbi:hypothetical protein Syun_012111 [Stephania yunnanensis]|uniref:Uncharacterized protein n=1 Tax=Stephania yunnanensis TaxID=152371 RepID=A0AAP0JZ19_9MAGN
MSPRLYPSRARVRTVGGEGNVERYGETSKRATLWGFGGFLIEARVPRQKGASFCNGPGLFRRDRVLIGSVDLLEESSTPSAAPAVFHPPQDSKPKQGALFRCPGTNRALNWYQDTEIKPLVSVSSPGEGERPRVLRMVWRIPLRGPHCL